MRIRPLTTPEDYAACVQLQELIWGAGDETIPAIMLQVSQKVGAVAAGAFDPRGRMLGFVFGLTGLRNGRLAHWSHGLAVRPEARDQGIGRRLKRYQRSRLLAMGVNTMYWTYDPLVARNAHLNLNRLGAEVEEYVVDMYGSNTGSALHGKVPTDRIVIGWELDKAYTPTAGVDAPRNGDESTPLVNPVSDGTPRLALTDGAPTVRLQVPHDSSALSNDGEQRVLEWRYTVRDAFNHYLGRGYHVSRFVRRGSDALPYYVLSR